MIDRAIELLKDRGVEGWEADRDGPASAIISRLKDTALVVTLGGDGTFLAGARLAAPRGIPILGVNLGRLGFLTELEEDQLDRGLRRFLDGDYRIEERTILQVVLGRGERTVARSIGLNEVVVDHSGAARMLRVEIDVGGQAVGDHRRLERNHRFRPDQRPLHLARHPHQAGRMAGHAAAGSSCITITMLHSRACPASIPASPRR